MKILVTLILATMTLVNPTSNNDAAIYDYYEGIQKAKETNKPILLFFTSRKCEYPLLVNQLIERDSEINNEISNSFIKIILFVDDQTKLTKEKKVKRDGKMVTLRTKGNEWSHIEVSKYQSNAQPFIGIINSNEELLKQPLIGKISKDEILEYLKN